MSLGANGLAEVSKTSVINTNYLIQKLSKVRGVTMAYPKQARRLDQVRFSLEKLKEETGIGTDEVTRRATDFGVNEFFKSHHPWVVPEPFLPEPCETYSKEDIDYWIAIVKQVCEEAYTNPDYLRTAPHNQAIAKINEKDLNDPQKYASTWRAYLRKIKFLC